MGENNWDTQLGIREKGGRMTEREPLVHHAQYEQLGAFT